MHLTDAKRSKHFDALRNFWLVQLGEGLGLRRSKYSIETLTLRSMSRTEPIMGSICSIDCSALRALPRWSLTFISRRARRSAWDFYSSATLFLSSITVRNKNLSFYAKRIAIHSHCSSTYHPLHPSECPLGWAWLPNKCRRRARRPFLWCLPAPAKFWLSQSQTSARSAS